MAWEKCRCICGSVSNLVNKSIMDTYISIVIISHCCAHAKDTEIIQSIQCLYTKQTLKCYIYPETGSSLCDAMCRGMMQCVALLSKGRVKPMKA